MLSLLANQSHHIGSIVKDIDMLLPIRDLINSFLSFKKRIANFWILFRSLRFFQTRVSTLNLLGISENYILFLFWWVLFLSLLRFLRFDDRVECAFIRAGVNSPLLVCYLRIDCAIESMKDMLDLTLYNMIYGLFQMLLDLIIDYLFHLVALLLLQFITTFAQQKRLYSLVNIGVDLVIGAYSRLILITRVVLIFETIWWHCSMFLLKDKKPIMLFILQFNIL